MVSTFLSWLLQLNNSWNCADPRTAVVCFLSTSPYQRTQELPCCYSWFPCIVYSVQRNRNKLLKYPPLYPPVSLYSLYPPLSDSEDDPSMRNFEEADANVFFIEQKYKGVKWKRLSEITVADKLNSCIEHIITFPTWSSTIKNILAGWLVGLRTITPPHPPSLQPELDKSGQIWQRLYLAIRD